MLQGSRFRLRNVTAWGNGVGDIALWALLVVIIIALAVAWWWSVRDGNGQ